MGAGPRPLWRCSECGRRFANRNQWHSCGRYSVRRHLRQSEPTIAAIYRRFERAVRACGPVIVSPTKTRIGFKVRMTFAAVSLRRRWMDAHVILARRLEHPRFRRVTSYSPRCHEHAFRIQSAAEIDADVRAWLAEAYRVGRQEHLESGVRDVLG